MLLTVPPQLDDPALAAGLNRDPATADRTPWTTWDEISSDLDSVAIWVQESHDPAAVQGLVGYFFNGAAALGGEWDCGPVLTGPDGGQLYLFYLDGTKSRRDDLYSVISDEFDTFLCDGSPVRKSNRAGAGTAGTRKWSGLHGPRAVAWR